nr:Probable D tyrosyl tRNATyr deacylase 2 [Hymenolepis microstoma]
MAPGDSVVARLVFQRCTKAKLLLTEGEPKDESDFISINEGLLVFIAFLGDITPVLQNLVKIICTTKICEKDGKYVSILDYPCDVILIPHFCLGGRLKGKSFQYHSIVSKDEAEHYFNLINDGCSKFAASNSHWASSGHRIYAGTFGIRQNLTVHSNGPFTHVVEI